MLGDFNPNLHYFYLNTVCYTWRVRSNYLDKPEQYLSIPRATRSTHPLLKINRTCNPRKKLILLAFIQLRTANMATVCITLCTVYYYQLSIGHFLPESSAFLFKHCLLY